MSYDILKDRRLWLVLEKIGWPELELDGLYWTSGMHVDLRSGGGVYMPHNIIRSIIAEHLIQKLTDRGPLRWYHFGVGREYVWCADTNRDERLDYHEAKSEYRHEAILELAYKVFCGGDE